MHLLERYNKNTDMHNSPAKIQKTITTHNSHNC